MQNLFMHRLLESPRCTYEASDIGLGLQRSLLVVREKEVED